MKRKSGNSYVLMLVYVDKKWLDIGGNRYSFKNLIEAKDFVKDVDVRHGLLGIPWGRTNHLLYEKIKGGHWIVVKIEENEDLIKVNDFYNRYKFKNGVILHKGDICSASEYILKQRNRKDFAKKMSSIKPKDVVGSKKWLKQYYAEREFN
jgi:hypothetical protein